MFASSSARRKATTWRCCAAARSWAVRSPTSASSTSRTATSTVCSYCERACSARARATLTSSPPGRPCVKSGTDTPAKACQIFVPDPNHFENSVLCVPYWPLMTKVGSRARSEEHTSELQSRQYLVCRLLLEKKKNKRIREES